MKKFKLVWMLFIALSLGFTACNNEPEIPPYPEEYGDGTEQSPYSVASAILNQGAKDNTDYKWVEGYIVGIWEGKDAEGNDLYPNNFAKFEAPFYTNLNVLIAGKVDETSDKKVICVQLTPGDIRNLLNLVDNGDIHKKKVRLCGALESYNKLPGMKSTQYVELDGGASAGTKPGEGTGQGSGDGTEQDPYSVATAMKNQGAKDNTDYKWVAGYIVGIWEGKDAEGNDIYPDNFAKFEAPFYTNLNILIADAADETNAANVICVQLPGGDIRNLLNLVDNGGVHKKKVLICGALEKYNNLPGLKSPQYVELDGGASAGTKPGGGSADDAIFSETMLTQAGFDKFTAYNVTGDQVWKFDSRYGAVMSGYADNRSYQNEDWIISPAIDLSKATGAKLTFDHARGPAGSINVGVTEGYYTVWVSNNYTDGAPSTATWTQLEGITYGTDAWAYVSSGALTIPAANLKANARIAFKYLCTDSESATWEFKNVVVK
jgi:hypothetical protein